MDLTKNGVSGPLLLRAATIQDGNSVPFKTIAFRVESGTAILSDGPSSRYKVVTLADHNATVIAINADVEITGGNPKIITAKLYLNQVPATQAPKGTPVAKTQPKAPANVISLVLTAEDL